MEASLQYIVALALAGLSAWAITAISSGTVDRVVSAFGLLIGGWRADPWPCGVQEEDRDRPWGWRMARALARSRTGDDDRVGPVPATRVRPRTTAR